MSIIIKSENIYDNDFTKKNKGDVKYIANYNNIVKEDTHHQDIVSQTEYFDVSRYSNQVLYECKNNAGDTLENVKLVPTGQDGYGSTVKFLSKEIILNTTDAFVVENDMDDVLGHNITAYKEYGEPSSSFKQWMTAVIDYEKTTNDNTHPNGLKEKVHVAVPVFVVNSKEDFDSIPFLSKNADGTYKGYEDDYLNYLKKYAYVLYHYLEKHTDEYGTTEEWVEDTDKYSYFNLGMCYPFPFKIGIDVKRSTNDRLVFYLLTAVADVAPENRDVDTIEGTFNSTSSLIAMFNHDIFCTEIRVSIGTENVTIENSNTDSSNTSSEELPTNELTQSGNTITVNNTEIPFDEYLTSECNKNYENGKETFEIECSVNDYYYGSWDSANNRVAYELDEYGKPRKAIDISGSQADKMVFEIGDIVIPMKYTNKGDVPMSQYIDGTARAYRVTGVSYSYDGVVMQKIRAQEIARENLTNSIMSANIETYRSMR